MQSSLSKDYFELFGLPVSYNVESDKLAQRYRELQHSIHPDRFTTSSDQERRLSLQLTAQVNEAFQTLKNPMLRAKYLLNLRGITPDQRDIALNPEFLNEQMELRERLSEISATAESRDELLKMQQELQGRHNDLQQNFGQQFDIGSTESLQNAGMIFLEMQFIDKILHEITELDLEV